MGDKKKTKKIKRRTTRRTKKNRKRIKKTRITRKKKTKRSKRIKRRKMPNKRKMKKCLIKLLILNAQENLSLIPGFKTKDIGNVKMLKRVVYALMFAITTFPNLQQSIVTTDNGWTQALLTKNASKFKTRLHFALDLVRTISNFIIF